MVEAEGSDRHEHAAHPAGASMNRNFTIAAFLGVKDEVELIERSILHLRAIGVDKIIVCDMVSTDSTLEILEKYLSEDLSFFSVIPTVLMTDSSSH